MDVSDARRSIKELSDLSGHNISFTAFIAACFTHAIAQNMQVHAYLDWRRRLVTFHDVDVVMMIEPEADVVAIPHIIRSTNRKTVIQISEEIRAVQARPESSAQAGKLTRLAPNLPRFMRIMFFRILKLNPTWYKKVAGTVIVTSVGMFGKGGGWGIGFLPTHNLGITVGGISEKPGVKEGDILIREYLNLTISFDHDIIDGAPAARFSNSLVEIIETGSVLNNSGIQLSKEKNRR